MTGPVSQQIVPQQITVRVVRETDNALPAYETAHSAELVLMTHRAREDAMQRALGLLAELPVVHEVGNMVRVEEWD